MPATTPAPMSRTDAEIASRFGSFVDSHRDKAVRLAWRLVGGDDALAEDVAQEAFLKAFRALPRFRGDAELSTWFYRVLVHQAHSSTRKRATRRRLMQLFHIRGDAQSETTAAIPDPGLQRRIGLALMQLTRAQREVFVLVHMEGRSVSVTAQLLRKAPGTVKSHLHRALKKMRRELRDLSPVMNGAKR